MAGMLAKLLGKPEDTNDDEKEGNDGADLDAAQAVLDAVKSDDAKELLDAVKQLLEATKQDG